MSDGFIREQVPYLIDIFHDFTCLMASSENRSKSNRYIPRLYMSDGFIREQVPYLRDIFHDFTCLMASSENRSLI